MSSPPSDTSTPHATEFYAHLAHGQYDLLAFARVLTSDLASAHDLLQEALVTAWQRYADFDHSKDFGAWVRGILRYKYKESLRKNKKLVYLNPDDLQTLEEHFLQASINKSPNPLLESLNRCLVKLPEKLKSAIEVVYYQRQSAKNAAKILGITSPALRKRLERARQALAQCITLHNESSHHVSL